MQKDVINRILAFALHLDDRDTDARNSAMQRSWLDEFGVPTREGLDLIKSLSQQSATRSVYRFIQ